MTKHKKSRLKQDDYKCCNCGSPATHAHHIVPVALGGLDVLSNIASLCNNCHGAIHGIDFSNHAALTRAGQIRTGNFGGRQPVPDEKKEKIVSLRAEGLSIRQISALVEVSSSAVHRLVSSQLT